MQSYDTLLFILRSRNQSVSPALRPYLLFKDENTVCIKLCNIDIPKSEQSITLYYPSLIGEIPHRTDCSGTKFLAQSKGGDPIKDETIQSSVQSLTHLMRNL